MFGKALKEARIKANLSQKELAYILYNDAFRHTTISGIENDKISVSEKLAIKLESILKINDNSLISALLYDNAMQKKQSFKNETLFKKAIMKIVAVFLLFFCLSPIASQASTPHNSMLKHKSYSTVIYLIGSAWRGSANSFNHC